MKTLLAMKNLFKILFICLSFTSYSQTGPGGVGNSSNNSFWLDAHQMNFLNGAKVGLLNDISGNNNVFSQSIIANQPTFVTGALNGLPVVRFDGVNDFLVSGGISAIESTDLTFFIVYKKSSLETNALIGANYSSNPKQWQMYSNSNNNTVFTIEYSTGSAKGLYYLDNVSSYNFSSVHYTPSGQEVYKEGNLMYSNSFDYAQPSGHNFVTLGKLPNSDNYFLNGDIAEVFIFNTTLNSLERIIIENYLGAKYNKTIPEDYFAYEATHNIGLIGIGNDGTNVHVTSNGVGAVEISNATALSANEYLFVGHTDVDLITYTTTDLPPAVSTHTRWSRTWRVDETGDVGTTTLTFDMSGVNGFGEPATYKLLVDDNGGFSNATVVAGTFNASNQTFTVDIDLSVGQYFTISGVFVTPVGIHSITSGDWNNSATWDCTCIPSVTDTVYVEPSHNVSINGNAFTYDLIVESTGTLTMSTDFDLSVHGDFTINGLVSFTDGQIGLVGTENQTINANGGTVNLNKVLIENTNTSIIDFTNGTYVLNSTLVPNKGIMNIGIGGVFIINSTSATTTGRVGVMSPSFTLIGNVTVKRFLPPGLAGNRLITPTVNGANLSMWDADIYISGVGFPDGCAYDSDGCYYSAKLFSGGNLNEDYEDIHSPTHPLVSGIGYQLFIGDDLTSFSGATLSSTGTLNSASDVVLSNPNIGANWNIIGNPYASAISFAPMEFSHMSNYYYVYDAQTEAYQWYYALDNTSSIPSLANGVIAMGQGFWVINGGSSSIVFKQSYKTSATATFIRSSEIDKSIYLELTQEGTTYRNVVNVDFNQEAFDGKDSLDMFAFTIGKQKSSSIYIDADEELLAKNYMNEDGRDKIIDLSIKILNDDYYTISATNLENVFNYTNITLHDLVTNEIIDLRKTNYTFYAIEDDESKQRFQLILSNESLGDGNNSTFTTSTNEGIAITQIGNAIDVNSDELINGVSQVLVTNLLGQDVLFTEGIQIQKGVNMVYLPEELKGFYLVTVRTPIGVVTKKIIL